MLRPPAAPKFPLEIIQHGIRRIDNYAWIRDENWKNFIKGDLNFKNPAVEKYISDENAYTESVMSKHKPLQDKLYQEILGRVKEDDQTYPLTKGEYLYYTRTIQGEDYEIYCRKKNLPQSEEEIYFDTNKEAESFDLYQLKGKTTNKSNSYLLYGFNTTGSLEVNLRVRNLENLQELNWQIEECNGSFLWINDEDFLYVERDQFSRGKDLYLVNIHQGPEKKKLIFSKPSQYENMFMSIELTSDELFCVISFQSGGSSVNYTYCLEDGIVDFFSSGENDVGHDVDHWGQYFYISHNENNADHYQIDRTPTHQRDRKNWENLIPESKSRYITSYSITSDKLVFTTKNTDFAIDQLYVYDLKNQHCEQVHFPDEVYTLDVFGAYDPFSPSIRLFYESPICPSQDIDLHLSDLTLEVLHTEEVPSYNPEQYVVKREFANSHDGQLIPLTIVTQRHFVKDAKSPAYIYGYGSYSMAYPPHFSQAIFSLVDRGFSVTLAHIRGGDEKGHQWYLQGKMRNKKNTFLDFISSCEFLISQKYTSAGQICASGASAGGLLMGAIINMQPTLFKAVIADVAFVDIINTISDETLPLTAPEWEEWGNPITNKDDFEYMLSYSPYDNVIAQDYPALLFNTGISDEQVTYWEPTKMVARLREFKTDQNLLLLKVKMHAGHAGASKRYEWIEDKAFDYAFILSQY